MFTLSRARIEDGLQKLSKVFPAGDTYMHEGIKQVNKKINPLDWMPGTRLDFEEIAWTDIVRLARWTESNTMQINIR